MKRLVFAALVGLGLSATGAQAAPAIGAVPSVQNNVEKVWYDRWGRWHPNGYGYHRPWDYHYRAYGYWHRPYYHRYGYYRHW